MNYRDTIRTCDSLCLTLLLSLLSSSVFADRPADPLGSPMWDYLAPKFIGQADYLFDDRVRIDAPDFAEDPTQVPITVDATAFAGDVSRIVAWTDLNPIQHIFTFYPHPEVIPKVSLRIRVQQGTPIRAAVQTSDGLWHVGYQEIDAQGGGCTAPTMATTNPYWERHLGEIESAQFTRATGNRYRFKVIHPMDTGLVNAIPEFYIENLEIRDAKGDSKARMELSPPISENPVFTFEFNNKNSKYRLWMRDNGGNIFEAAL